MVDDRWLTFLARLRVISTVSIGGRFGPVLADSAGKFNFLPARDAIDTHTPAFLSMQRDDVSELGSTASRAVSEHDGNDKCRWHAHAQRDPERRHRQQQQQNEVESVRSCDSLSTLHSESERSRCTNATSLSVGGSTVTTPATSMGGSGHRREKQKQRRKKRDRDRKNDSRSHPPVSAVESMHFEGHLLHRVCEVTGRLPDGGGDGSNSEADSDGERSEMSLLEDSGEHQLARLRRSPEMMSILVKLKALSTSLVDRNDRGVNPGSSSQAPGGAANGNVATGTGGRAGIVRFAQQEYLRLFEEMLGELLRTQREKRKVTNYCMQHVNHRAKGLAAVQLVGFRGEEEMR